MGRWRLVVACGVLAVTTAAVGAGEPGPTLQERVDSASLKVRLALTGDDLAVWEKAHRELAGTMEAVEKAWDQQLLAQASKYEPEIGPVVDALNGIAQAARVRAGLRYGLQRSVVLRAVPQAKGRDVLRALRADSTYRDSLPSER